MPNQLVVVEKKKGGINMQKTTLKRKKQTWRNVEDV